MEGEDGWVRLGQLGQRLANIASDFDPRTFGFRKLSDLVAETDAFDIDRANGGAIRVRVRALDVTPKSRRRGRTGTG
jgi:Fe-S-cluster formation regulator IscX/YfhJ